jgi:hypothetical protein
MTEPCVDLGNGITATCDGYTIRLTQEVLNARMYPGGLRQHITLGAPALHALIAFARERGLLEG